MKQKKVWEVLSGKMKKNSLSYLYKIYWKMKKLV